MISHSSNYRRWLVQMWENTKQRSDLVIADMFPQSYEAYARVFPPIEVIRDDHVDEYRWSDLARTCGVQFSALVRWATLTATLSDVKHELLRTMEIDDISSNPSQLSTQSRISIGSALRANNDSDVVYYGVWDGYRTRESYLGKPNHIGSWFRSYYVWSGRHRDFSSFRASDSGDSWFCAQELAWPESRSWFYHADTDWTTALVGGPGEIIHDLLCTAELEVLEIDRAAPVTVL